MQAKKAEEFDDRRMRADIWSTMPPEQRRTDDVAKSVVPDPAHEIQPAEGLADYWYLDDGHTLCGPRLVMQYLINLDEANRRLGE